jgi:hypothetical protein
MPEQGVIITKKEFFFQHTPKGGSHISMHVVIYGEAKTRTQVASQTNSGTYIRASREADGDPPDW